MHGFWGILQITGTVFIVVYNSLSTIHNKFILMGMQKIQLKYLFETPLIIIIAFERHANCHTK